MAAEKTADKTPVNIRKNILKSFLKSLLIPGLLLAFFIAAPYWLGSKLHSEFDAAIANSSQLNPAEKEERRAEFARIDFQQVCSANYPPEYQKLHDDLEESGIVLEYQALGWSLDASILLVVLLILAMVLIYVLNLQAGKSQDKLISNYRTGYQIAIAVSLLNVALLIPLLAYGSFKLSTFLMDAYFPKLLIGIVLIGLIALWGCASILLRKIPLEFQEPMSRELTPEDAPELWQSVREAAAFLQTDPPDHIITGMQTNFYVTELAVKHNKGQTRGKTLFISYPLLKHLTWDEVLAVIGHELGHFIGNDTRLTRQFYPLRYKTNHTMAVLATAGWVGWPSLELMLFFFWCFEETVNSTSRDREFLADTTGANLTSQAVMARALVKIQVALEVFNKGINDALKNPSLKPLDIDLKTTVHQDLISKADFWTQLFAKKMPHPLDTHPPLQDRLKNLGHEPDATQAQTMTLEEGLSAQQGWFAGREGLFTELTTELEQALDKNRSRTLAAKADYQTEEGKALLDTHFPEIRWPVKAAAAWVGSTMLMIVALIGLAGVIAVGDLGGKAIFICVTLLFGTLAVINWKRYRGAEMVLNAEGISYTTWKESLRFEDIANVSGLTSYGSPTHIIVRFKQSRKSPVRYGFPGLKIKQLRIPLRGLKEKPNIVLQTVFRYFTRQTE